MFQKAEQLLAVLDKHTKCRSDNGYRTWAGSEQGASGFARLCRKLETYKAMLNGLAFRGITGALAVAKTFVQHPVPERSAVSRAEFERRFDGKRDVRESVDRHVQRHRLTRWVTPRSRTMAYFRSF